MSDTNDMLIDTDNFNFLDLEDINEADADINGYKLNDDKKTTKRTKAIEKHEASFNPEDFLIDDEEEPESELEDWEEPEEVDEVADISNREKELHDATETFNELDEDSVVNVDGIELSKAEIRELAKTRQRIEEESQFIKSEAENFEKGNEWIIKQYTYNKSIIDTNIERLESIINNPSVTDAEYRQARLDLETAKVEQRKQLDLANESLRIRKAQEDSLNANRIRHADFVLSETIPEYNRYKGKLLEHAKAMGFTDSKLLKEWDVPLAKMILNSYMFEKNKERAGKTFDTIKEKVKTARSTSSNVKSSRISSSNAAKPKVSIDEVNSNNTRVKNAIWESLTD